MLKFVYGLSLTFFGAQAVASSVIEIDGNSLEYEIKGSGDIAVLFDAGALSGLEGWDSVWGNLPLEITAIRFSRLGEGNSGPCKGQRSKSDYVNEVDKLLAALNINRPIVYVGHSLGGITARNFAAQYQGDVTAMLMVDPANPRDVDIFTQLDPINGPAKLEKIKKNDYDIGKDRWCFLNVIWDKSKAVGFSEIGDIPVILIAGLKVSDSPSNVLETEEGRKLWGLYQSEWVKNFPQGVFVAARDSGHFVQDDQPEVVLKELIKLLEITRDANTALPRTSR